MDAADIVVLCKALGDPVRFAVVDVLARHGETCACELLERFDVTQPTLSHHMKILCEANLVVTRKEGKWSHYQINQETFRAFSLFISQMNQIEEGINCSCGK